MPSISQRARSPCRRGGVALSQGRFFIPDLRPDPQQGEITFKANGDTPAVLELLDHEPLGYIQSVGLKPDFLGGTAEGAFTLTMPLLANLEFNQIKFRGTARLNDAIAANWSAPSTSPAARSMSTSPNSRSRPKARSASRASRPNLPGSASSTRRMTASRRSR